MLGDVAVVVAAEDGRLHVVLIRINICDCCRTLKVCAIPCRELVHASLSKRRRDVALRVVGPDLGNVQVFDEDNRISTPELFGRHKSARRNNTTGSELGALFDTSTLKNDTFVTDHDIVLNMARVKSAAGANRHIVANRHRGRHASR